jgi:hypothetical protein
MTVWLTVTKPTCRRGEEMGLEEIPLRWEAFGIHHVYDLSVRGGADFLAIELCSPPDIATYFSRF